MVLLNGNVRDMLERVRLRQIPWHKNRCLFAKLHVHELVNLTPQRSTSMPERSASTVAVLTDKGKSELRRLAQCPRDVLWNAAEIPVGNVHE